MHFQTGRGRQGRNDAQWSGGRPIVDRFCFSFLCLNTAKGFVVCSTKGTRQSCTSPPPIYHVGFVVSNPRQTLRCVRFGR
jgi:hypothetical protein